MLEETPVSCLRAIWSDTCQNARQKARRRTLAICVVASLLVASACVLQSYYYSTLAGSAAYWTVSGLDLTKRVLLKQDVPPSTPAPSTATNGKAPRKRVALAFYGLTRSLQYTVDSIESNVLHQLELAGYDYDIFLHTYSLQNLKNERTGEAAQLNTSEWKLLKPDYVEVAEQNNFLQQYALPIDACLTHTVGKRVSNSSVDYYEDSFTSVRNLMCQLNSLSAITRMWRAAEKDYHAVIYLRPDVLYNCPLPTNHLDELQDNTLYIADFHHWHGYNDRFAMGTPATAALWGDRLQYVLATCTMQQIHAEMTVARVLAHHHVRVQLIPFNFFRVRANGLLSEKDYGGRYEISICDADMIRPFSERRERLGLPLQTDTQPESITTTGRRRAARERTVARLRRRAQAVGDGVARGAS